MYGEHYSSMTLELNASDDRGIDVVRDQIKEFAGTKKLFRVNITPDGAEAILQLAGGDLRRVLNLLQTTQMAHSEVNQETAAIPAVVETIFLSLMNDSFEKAYQNLMK
eukprot:gene26281-28747_t